LFTIPSLSGGSWFLFGNLGVVSGKMVFVRKVELVQMAIVYGLFISRIPLVLALFQLQTGIYKFVTVCTMIVLQMITGI
jgi:hypothetical protein